MEAEPEEENDMTGHHCKAESPNRYICTELAGHTGDHIAKGFVKIHDQWPQDPILVHQRSRLDRLISLSSNGAIHIETVARIFDCPEASIRRDIFTLRQEGYYITLERKQIRNFGKREALLAPQEAE